MLLDFPRHRPYLPASRLQIRKRERWSYGTTRPLPRKGQQEPAGIEAQHRAKHEDFMANTVSAKKAVRKIERKTAVNRDRRSKMRSYIRRVDEAVASGDHAAAAAALKDAQPLIMRAANAGIVHKNAAARKVSRLTRKVKALEAS
jgi:small subunit ribosomal protein S20